MQFKWSHRHCEVRSNPGCPLWMSAFDYVDFHFKVSHRHCGPSLRREGEAIQSGHTLDCFVPRNDDGNPLNRVQFKWSHRHYGPSLRTQRVKQSRAGTLDCFVPRNDDGNPLNLRPFELHPSVC
ncbi:MAG: hypothetical protein LBS88_11575 [Tannerellaceae bacterium]|nr:hypothetical protein [Tannerellaceae bacterium]